MKRIIFAAVLCAALPASARHSLEFGTLLTGYQEVPVVSTRADGVFRAKWDRDATSFEYELTYEGLQAPITQAHIHLAQKSVNGPIIIWLCGTPSNPGPAGTQTCPASGTVRGVVASANVLGSATQQLAAGEISEVLSAMRAWAAYVNVHTTASPGGEIRGQVFPLGR